MFKKIVLIIFIICIFSAVNVFADEIADDQEMLLLDPELEQQMFLDINILFCVNSKCDKEKKYFFVNDSFFITYKSDSKLPIKAEIKLKNSNFRDIIYIPDYYQFKEKGEYEITFNIDIKDFKGFDYKKIIEVKDFEENKVCNIDGKCFGQETAQNCPQDCSITNNQNTGSNKVVNNNRKNIFFISIAATVLALLIILIILIIKIKKPNNRDNNPDIQD